MITLYGAGQKCPKCGGLNPSGFSLPSRCLWCGPYRLNNQIKEMAKNIVKEVRKEESVEFTAEELMRL